MRFSPCFGALVLAASLPILDSFMSGQMMVLFAKGILLTDAPPTVQAAVQGANRIAGKPYKYSGGHGEFEDDGYDCSGSVSYVLHAAGLLEEAGSSSDFLKWGEEGEGKWITVYARSGHVFLVIGGARFDTTDHADIGPGWRENDRVPKGFVARHPKGL